MDNPQETKNQNEKWLGGFFDAEGHCSFSQGSLSIGIVNTNPLAIAKCQSVFRGNGIEANVSERSKPSKSSKKKRWDLFINKADEAIKAAAFLKKVVYGKTAQLDLILEYSNIRKNTEQFHKRMMYLNQTSNILVKDDAKLYEKLGFVPEKKEHENVNEETKRIHVYDNFCDIYYLVGIFDGEGTVSINKRENKYRNTDRYTPIVSMVNTNKEIISRAYSTIKKSNVGCFVANREKTKRNRMRWDLLISGLKRVKAISEYISDKATIKRQQLEEVNAYCFERLKQPKGINDIGHVYKAAIEALNKQN